MDSSVVGKLGVESGGHGSSLPDRDGIGSFRGEHYDAIADVGNLGRSNEDHFEGQFGEAAFEIAQEISLLGSSCRSGVRRRCGGSGC